MTSNKTGQAVSPAFTNTGDVASVVEGIPRASYADISLYAPARIPVRVDLSDNINLWGPPPSVSSTLKSVDPGVVTRYPVQPMTELTDALARFTRVDPACVVTGCGSDDLLDCMMRAFAEPGDIVVHATPTFSMIPYFARTNGLVPKGIPLRKADWDIDAGAMLDTRARITYLCAPNNPTGTMISAGSVQRILDESTGIVVLDEAYIEFAGGSWCERAGNEGRLVVTRTLSKAFGLAGIRIGYAVGAPALVHEIEKARGPYKVTALTERIALSVLEQDEEWVRASVASAVDAREWLEREIRGLGLQPLPSRGNFLLIPVREAATHAEYLASRGILVRAFTNLPVVGDALRIGVAPLPMLLPLVAALRDAIAKFQSPLLEDQ